MPYIPKGTHLRVFFIDGKLGTRNQSAQIGNCLGWLGNNATYTEKSLNCMAYGKEITFYESLPGSHSGVG